MAENNNEEEQPVNDGYSKFIVICFLIWAIIGMLGFFMSLICFFYEGTTTDKFVGLLTSIVLGPIYWFYYALSEKGYCSPFQQEGQQQQQQQQHQQQQQSLLSMKTTTSKKTPTKTPTKKTKTPTPTLTPTKKTSANKKKTDVLKALKPSR